MKKIFKNKKVLFVLIGLLVVAVTYLGISFSEELENDVEVTPNTTLTYYLNVTYDGIDRNGVHSNDTTIANINSGYMEVTDRIPDGLTFEGFVTTADGTIGAVRRNDESVGCLGRVVDDTEEATLDATTETSTEFYYHGLHYNKSNRTVTFKVNRLQAGCKLTVGIITRTPATIDDPETVEIEKRRDFYNFGSIIEKALSKNSNTVHVYMGKDNLPMYNVVYQYTGTVPSNAPSVPITSSYVEGSSVGVANNPMIEGYTFSGWTTTDATISDGVFSMPGSNVTLTGSFTEKTKYVTRYSITGTTPTGYVLPLTKNYYQDAIVEVDSMKAGDVFNGYRFLGWGTSDADVTSDGNFVMPNHDVTLVGNFELVTYTVTYAFYDTVLPPNSDTLLPASETHRPGETVTLATIENPTGYRFLGWYKEDNFVMPDGDITIYGEWAKQNGTFEPTITKTVNGTQTFFGEGETVNFNIVVTNTANYAIHDVIIRENNENARFVASQDYEIQSDHYVKINSIPANGSVTLNATYVVLGTDRNKVTNEVELVGALADNDYILLDEEYKASVEFNIKSKITVCKAITGPSLPNTFQFHITNSGFDTWMTLKKDECDSVYVEPGTYAIMEIIPQEYEVSRIDGLYNYNDYKLDVYQGNDYTVTFTNKFRQKGFYHSFGRIENKVEVNN